MSKSIAIVVALFCGALLLGAGPLAAQPGPQGDRRVKVIVDNDLSGDPDGLFALAQQLLCESVDLRGIIGAHVGGGGSPMGRGDQAAASVQKAKDLLEVMGLSGKFAVVKGASARMERPDVPQDSEGAQLIIEEARECTPERPLFVCMGGSLTDVSSALLLAPDIAPNMIVIWIGGQEYPFGHPQPWGGISEVEYNLNLDIPATRYLFNDSSVRLWQVPRDMYRQCLYSFASMERHIRPLGAVGAFLMESLERWRRFSSGAVYCLGDSPLVLLSSLQTFFEPDTASSDFVQTSAPYITEDGRYDFSRAGRAVRVYTRIDTYLMFKDMEDRLAVKYSE